MHHLQGTVAPRMNEENENPKNEGGKKILLSREINFLWFLVLLQVLIWGNLSFLMFSCSMLELFTPLYFCKTFYLET